MPHAHKSKRPIALVTGASMGIGQDLARHFCGAGYDLVLVARSVDKLEAFSAEMQQKHGCTVWVEPADLAKPLAAQKLHTALQRKQVQIDALVNCAGVMQQNAFERLSSAQHLHMIHLNIAGLTDMLSHFLPGMTARGSGRVLNVASIAAFQPVPMLATYAATKAYVLSLSEALAVELKGTGVTVTTLCPGITATAMVQGAMDANANMRQIPDFLIAKADDVARLGFEACMRGDVICVPGVINRAAMIVSRGTPKWLIRAIGGALGRRA